MPQLPSIDRIPGGRRFAALSRRVRTLVVAGLLFVVLFVLALVLPVPYVILSPGPTYNTLGQDPFSKDPVIVLHGTSAKPTSGHLNMTTVQISGDNVSPFQALVGWLKGDEVVLPETAIRPPGVSDKEQQKQDAQDFVTSQDSATVAALCQLGYPKGFGVVTVLNDSPARGLLKPGDQIVSVAGRPAGNATALTAVVETLTPGRPVPVVVKRQGRTTQVQVKPGPAPKGAKGARLGISVSTTCLAPFTVTIHLENVGGPSAGLMFALGIIDKVGSTDLTKGRFIAGTGEITADGKVEPIGGIQLKMIAAKRKGATVFLAPAGNCADVRKDTPSGLKVVKVSTLRDAVRDLVALQKGQPVPGC
jgi:PDZ domain-containing protein